VSRYRWLRPSKCIETMDFFPSLIDTPNDVMQGLLFEAVERGDVRGTLNDEIVPKAHIGAYLSLYQRASPEQDPHTLPPDLALNYDDLCSVFDRPTIDSRKRGRPSKERSGWDVDRRLAQEMHEMVSGRPGLPKANSAAHAARMLVENGRVPGAGTDESRAKRLERAFRKYYSS
jgi:hypothetical protein